MWSRALLGTHSKRAHLGAIRVILDTCRRRADRHNHAGWKNGGGVTSNLKACRLQNTCKEGTNVTTAVMYVQGITSSYSIAIT